MLTCGSCGEPNAPGSRFCEVCGTALVAPCAACGTVPRNPAARFCPGCGAALTGRPPSAEHPAAPAAAPHSPGGTVAERRVCSVMFADLVGFTPLSEARDPEEVRELLSRYFDTTRTVIGRYGGTVEKFIGDAVMAVWGAPTAAEGDTERAVRAALDVVDAVSALGVEIGAPTLAARAGVVTGEVAVTIGAVGQGMVAGDAVNTAARVQAAAAPGTVLVDAATRRLAAAAVGFADVGEHTLKGKAEPERLWQATRVLAGAGGSQRVDGLEARLVGRDAEMRTIRELFHAALERRSPRMVVVTGSPGVGKSRLGWEFEKYVDGLASLVRWHRGRCLSYGDGVAFWALAEAVRQRLVIAEDDPTDVAADKLAAGLTDLITDPTERDYVAVRLGRLLGLPVAGDSGGPLSREELFAGWRTFFERIAARQPVVWVVEDAQYADSGLLDFLDHLVDWSRELPIYLLVFARPELEERRSGFGTGRNRTTLTLDPLDAASMRLLVDELVPGMPNTARDAIVAHAQGVPLFAVETIRSLVDRDVVVPVEGSYRLVGDLGELSVPDSLHGLLAARLDALSPSVRGLVADASVLGASFPAEALVAVSDQDDATVRAGLTELLRREVLEVSADPLSPQRGQYRFSQQLLRQVAYDTLSRHDRKARHLGVAEHLRRTFADDGEEASDVIAQHYRDALSAVPDAEDAPGIREQAVLMSVRAAERALRAGAPATAVTNYTRAAEMAQLADPGRAAALFESAAKAANVAANHALAVQLADRARDLWQVTGDDRAAARVLALAGLALRRLGRHTEAGERVATALEDLRAEPDSDTVEALGELAALHVFSGSPDADRVTAEALELGQALDVPDSTMCGLLIYRGIMHSTNDRFVQSAALLREAARLGHRSGDGAHEAQALLNIASATAGWDPQGALEAALRAADMSRQMGARYMIGFAVNNAVTVLIETGEWERADQLLADAVQVQNLGDLDIIRMLVVVLAALRGDLGTADRLVPELSALRDSEDPQDLSAYELVEATVAYGRGDHRLALERARAALDRLDVLGMGATAIRWVWPLAVRAADALDDRAATADLVAMLDARPAGHRPMLLRAERDLVTARRQATADPTAAPDTFGEAIAALRRFPAGYHLGHALLDQAVCVPAAVLDPTPAVDEASVIAERLRCAPLRERVSQVSERLGLAAPAAVASPA